MRQMLQLLIIFSLLLGGLSVQADAGKKAPVVILKLDDFSSHRPGRRPAFPHQFKTIYEYLSARNIKFSIGVHCEMFTEDHKPTLDWMKERQTAGDIEFWCHGYSAARDEKGGQPGEFERSYEEQLALLQKCQQLAKEKLGFPLKSFGPHWSGTNEGTSRALREIPEITSWLYATPEQGQASGKHAYPRYLAVEYKTFLPNLEEFKKQWNRNAKNREAVVLQGHPKAWMWEEGQPRYQEFKKIIDFLIAEGCTFSTPSEYLETHQGTPAKALPAETQPVNEKPPAAVVAPPPASSKPITSNAPADPARSRLYPADWQPGFADAEGNFLPDFSYAGYRQTSVELPDTTGKKLADVTRPPYHADPTGKMEATAAIQQALDDLGQAGGGIVYLPPGTYRLKIPADARGALVVRYSNVILKGAGADQTRLWLDEEVSREKSCVIAHPDNGPWWFSEQPVRTRVTADLLRPTRDIPVESVEQFAVGDSVVLRNTVTQEFIDEHEMNGKWTAGDKKLRGIVLLRRIEAIDRERKMIRLDAPTFYEMKVRDQTRLGKLPDVNLQEVGFEDFSIGMKENPRIADWTERDPVDTAFSDKNNGAYEVHLSVALRLVYCENAFVRRVNSYLPAGNRKHHIHSNGIRLDYSRNITVTDCRWANPQYRGGGGNGYLYTLACNDSVIRDSEAVNGRHNIDFQNMHCSGNVIYNCLIKDGAIPADFHMYLSTGNLIDSTTCDGDYWESRFRPYGGSTMHGQSGAGNVFWNTRGLRYPQNKNFIIDSQQARRGMIIGTSGPANKISWKSTGLKEFIGKGEQLRPQSLWQDQLARRLKR